MIYNNITSGGLLFTQFVYLDFDGESTSYRGELLTVDEVVVEESGLAQDRIGEIVAALNAEFAERGVVFVCERPESGEYSTVFVGKTDAFAEMGNVTGIAETVDEGNANHSDNAFAIVNSSDSDEYIIGVIAHEVGHLLGDSHGGEGLEAYRARYDNTYVSNTQWSLSAGDSAYNTLVVTNGIMRVLGSSYQTLIHDTAREIISQGGVANTTVVSSGGNQIVSNGGIANGTVVSSGGSLNVSTGGVANDATVSDGGLLIVSEDGVVNGTVISIGGTQAVSNGHAIDTVISGGSHFVSGSEAMASGSILSNWGVETIADGAISYEAWIAEGVQLILSAYASNTVISGGRQELWGIDNTSSGGSRQISYAENTDIYAGEQVVGAIVSVVSTTIRSTGLQTVKAAGEAKDTVVLAGGKQAVEEWGVVSGTVLSGGSLHISVGQAYDVVVIEGEITLEPNEDGSTDYNYAQASRTVVSGGTLRTRGGTEDTVLLDGAMIVGSGGSDLRAVISGGSQVVSGGTATAMDLHGGNQYVSAGGVTQHGNVYEGTQYIGENGLATGAILDGNGSQVVENGGRADEIGIQNGATQTIRNGGYAEDAYLSTDGIQNIEAGGTAVSASINGAGTQNVWGVAQDFNGGGTGDAVQNVYAGGKAVRTVLWGGGVQNVFSGAESLDGEIGWTAVQNVHGGGSASGTLISGGTQNISEGGRDVSATIVFFGRQNVADGGYSEEATVSSGGIQSVHLGGSASGATAVDGGVQEVYGAADATTVSSGGTQAVYGAASGTLILGDGRQDVAAGGTASGAVVSGGIQDIAGSAADTKVYRGGNQNVFLGTVTDTEVFSGGSLGVQSGTADGVVIHSGGTAAASYGGILTGDILVGGYLELLNDANTVNAAVTLELTDRKAIDGVMINDIGKLANGISLIQGAGNIGSGVSINLADNAGGFQGTAGFDAPAGAVGSEFAHMADGNRFTGVAYDDSRSVLRVVNGVLQYYVHDRYQLLGDAAGYDYIGDDVSYTDMRGGSSAGVYAKLDQNYQAMIFGGGNRTAVSGRVTLDVGSGTVLATHLFGGGFWNNVDGSTEINLYAGATANGYVLGGGYNGHVTSNAVINAFGGTANAVYGGGRVDNAGASAHVETTTINLESGFSALKSNSYVYGGGIAAAAGVTASVASVEVNVNGASLAYLHGGGQASNGIATVNNVTITVETGTAFSAYLYGGGRASGSATSTVGEVNLKINGGSFTQVFGGGYSSGSGTSIVNTVNIVVSAGTFSGSLYGGAQRGSTGTGTASVGDVSITFDLTGVVNFAANMGVVMGGTTTSVVTGNTTLTLTGSGSNLKTGGGTFTGWLTAVAEYGIDHSKTHTLRFANFADSDFQARVRGFNHADFSGSTTVTVTSYFGWHTGSDFSFDLSGRSAMSGTAFMQQETGSLGITTDSLFNIELGTGDLGGTSGSFLLLDAMDGVNWNFGAECVNLTFDGISGTGTFNGNAIALEGYLFNLVYEQTDGTFLLTWSYSGTGDSSRSLLQGILA